jgi:hypothetical protein
MVVPSLPTSGMNSHVKTATVNSRCLSEIQMGNLILYAYTTKTLLWMKTSSYLRDSRTDTLFALPNGSILLSRPEILSLRSEAYRAWISKTNNYPISCLSQIREKIETHQLTKNTPNLSSKMDNSG